jgi:hypothetical protein
LVESIPESRVAHVRHAAPRLHEEADGGLVDAAGHFEAGKKLEKRLTRFNVFIDCFGV